MGSGDGADAVVGSRGMGQKDLPMAWATIPKVRR